MQYIRRNRKPLTQELINTDIAGRDYQIRAIRAVLEGIEQKKRDFLLVMATGTGKTRTCIALADALMRASHAERVLLLVDRIALREQALAAFKEHLPNEPRWPNTGEKLIAKDRRIYVATYREMVEALIVELTDHNPVLLKIRNGEVVTESEATELAELLHAEHPHITEQLLQQVYQNRKARFLQFIRHILGIEVLKSFPETVAETFDQFIQQHSNLNSRQLEFLSLLKGFILEREKVEKKDLISSPFTILHPQGIRGIFSPTEINDILTLTTALAS